MLSNLQRVDLFLAISHAEDAIRDLPASDTPVVAAIRTLLVSAVTLGRDAIDIATQPREREDCGHDLRAIYEGVTPRLELDTDIGEAVDRLDARDGVLRAAARSWDPITDQLVDADKLTPRRVAQVAALLDGGHHGEGEC